MAIAQDFIDTIKPMFESEAELQSFLDAAPRSLTKSIKLVNSRINPGGDYKDLKKHFEKLVSSDWTLSPTIFSQLHDQRYVDRENRTIALGRTIQHLGWFFYMQEVAASLPANFLDIPEGWIVLDVCAAPWGKSVQIADRLLTMNAKKPWLVLGNDVDRKRLQTWALNINRTWMYNTASTQMDGTAFGNLLPEFFDAVLVDAPCSGEWTSFKSDSALKRRKEESINKVAATQKHILTAAIKATKVWWSIIYSTCTLNHIENERMIRDILEDYVYALDLQVISLKEKSNGLTHYWDEQLLTEQEASSCVRCRPHRHHTWGFFVAKLHKKASIQSWSLNKKEKAQKKDHGSRYMTYETSKKLTKEVQSYIKESFWIVVDDEQYAFAASKENVYVTSPQIEKLLNKIPLTKIGIPILKTTRDWFRPLHGLWLVLGHLATKNTVELTDEDMELYSNMADIHMWEALLSQNSLDWFVIIKRKNYGISVGKVMDWMIKNKFIKW